MLSTHADRLRWMWNMSGLFLVSIITILTVVQTVLTATFNSDGDSHISPPPHTHTNSIPHDWSTKIPPHINSIPQNLSTKIRHNWLCPWEAGLPWGWNFNAHTHPISTEKTYGNPHRIPISTEFRKPPHPYPTPCVFLFDAYIILFFVMYAICKLM